MIAHEPQVQPTERFAIGEAAKILGVTRNTLSRWIREGYVKFGIRKCNGRKFIIGQELVKVWRMQY